MILLIDNYDSFAYNLYQMMGSIQPDIRVIRNDEMTVMEIEELMPQAIVLSSGPGKPGEAGVCVEAAAHFAGKIPILGVCLGHQAIYEAFGGMVGHAKDLMHGKQSRIKLMADSPLFEGLGPEMMVARYHSLAAQADTVPDELMVLACADDGEIMAVQHREYDVYGVQFHPESILTLKGSILLENFLKIAGGK